MYLHLGNETVIRVGDIIGIFDLENTSVSKQTKMFLSNAEKNGMVITVSQEMPKSFVVCQSEGKIKVYVSQISSQTLKKRSSYIEEIANI